MPMTSFTNISLSNIFQDLPFLVSSHGLFVDVKNIGKSPNALLSMTMSLTRYMDHHKGLLVESRLLRKMRHLPPCDSPCSFCVISPTQFVPEEMDTCPMCLHVTNATWTREMYTVGVSVLHDGRVVVTPDRYADILVEFLEPRFVKEIQKFEKNEAALQQIADDMEQKKKEAILRKRKRCKSDETDDSA